jgi:hypothetical protein
MSSLLTTLSNSTKQNLTLDYITKTLNQVIFFSPPKSEYFFQQHWESEFFLEKKHNVQLTTTRHLVATIF